MTGIHPDAEGATEDLQVWQRDMDKLTQAYDGAKARMDELSRNVSAGTAAGMDPDAWLKLFHTYQDSQAEYIDAMRDMLDHQGREPEVPRLGSLRIAPNGVPTLWLENEPMNLINSAYSAVGSLAFSAGKQLQPGYNNFFAGLRGRLGRIGNGLKPLVDEAYKRADDRGIVVMSRGRGIQSAIGSLREEYFHAWQQALEGSVWKHLDPIQFQTLNENIPQGVREYLRSSLYPDRPSINVSEAAAKLSTEKIPNVSTDDAATWLSDYFNTVEQRWGEGALDSLRHLRGVSKTLSDNWPAVRDQLREGYEKAGRGEQPSLTIRAGETEFPTPVRARPAPANVPSVEAGGQGGVAPRTRELIQWPKNK